MSNHSNHQHGSEGNNYQHGHVPYWKRAHTDWRFVVGVTLMFLAMIVYIMTGDLAWRPHFLSRHPLSMPADNGEGHPIP
jgi:hypothetical protein